MSKDTPPPFEKRAVGRIEWYAKRAACLVSGTHPLGCILQWICLPGQHTYSLLQCKLAAHRALLHLARRVKGATGNFRPSTEQFGVVPAGTSHFAVPRRSTPLATIAWLPTRRAGAQQEWDTFHR